MTMEELRGINSRFQDGFIHGEAVVIASVYADDAILLPSERPMVRGKQAIQDHWQGVIKAGVRSVKLQTLDLDEKGDTVIETGTSTVIAMGERGPVTSTGKYLVVWKRQPDGTWKYAVDIFNSDAARTA